MANDNILKAIIDVSAPGSHQVFKQIKDDTDRATGSLTELKQVSKSLKSEISGLDAALINSKGGKVLSNELRVVNAEIKALEKQANISGQAAGNALTKGFSGLRQLAFILPGIGIAGLFNVAFEGLEKFVGGLGVLGHSFNAAALDAELFKKASATSQDDIVRLNALVSVAKDVSLSTTQRKNAIGELQKLYPDYLRNISLETISSDAAKKAIDDLSQSIINKALVQEFSTRAAKEIIKQDELHQKVLDREAQSLSNINQLQKLRAEGAPANAIKKFSGLVDESIQKLGHETKEFNDQSAVVEHLTSRLKDLTATSLDFIKTPRVVKFKAEFIPVLGAGDLEKIVESFGGAGRILKDQKIRLGVIFDINQDPLTTDFGEKFKEISKDLQTRVENLTRTNPILIRANTKIELTSDQKAIQETIKQLNETIQQLASESIGSLADTFGETLAGGDLQKGFQSFVNVIASGFQAIGRQMVAAAPIIKALKEAIKTLDPAILLPAGIALIAIGAALRQSIQPRALGGPVSKGTPYLVGEQGPELFVPDSGGKIVSNKGLQGSTASISSGGMNISVTGYLTGRGSDLIAIITQEVKKQLRLN